MKANRSTACDERLWPWKTISYQYMKYLLTLLSLLLVPLAALQAKPNIIVILSDDMGYADIGAHGCKDIPAPNIDSIAKGGVRFTQFYNTARCWPTRGPIARMLYDHRADPDENINISEQSANAELAARLTERLRTGKGKDGDLPKPSTGN